MSQSYGTILRSLRLQRKLRLCDVAAVAGVDTSYISRIETGERPVPAEHVKAVLHQALKLSAEEIQSLNEADVSIRSSSQHSHEDRYAFLVLKESDLLKLLQGADARLVQRIRRKGGLKM